MSFYHVLPSNVAPNTFPNNHASAFSIPLDNPYTLSGKWEVAVMNMSYTGCVNTFNHDELVVSYSTDLKTRVLKTQSPVTWKVPQKKTVGDMLGEIKTSLKGILDLDISNTQCAWKLKSDRLFVIMSPGLVNAVKLEQDVITPWDEKVRNVLHIHPKEDMPNDVSLTFVPLAYMHHTIDLKDADDTLTLQQLISIFNQRVPNASMSAQQDSARITVNNHVILLSSALKRFLNYEQSGIHKKAPTHTYGANVMHMKEAWSVKIYVLATVTDHTSPLQETITLPPVSFQRQRDAVAYLNTHVPKARFSVDGKTYLQMKLEGAETKITFSDTLRDIFAFDDNTYVGGDTHKATGIFSLTRRIHYLYVYSSITDYVRIGNTEAPLLAVIPFSVSSNCDILKEESYKNPMYIPMRHSTVSQIDIEIYDDAGELVPFVAEAVTSLRLHYRQI